MFKVNNKNIKTRCEICSKLTINTLDSRQCCHSGVFLLIFNIFHTCYSAYIVDFEHVIAGRVTLLQYNANQLHMKIVYKVEQRSYISYIKGHKIAIIKLNYIKIDDMYICSKY